MKPIRIAVIAAICSAAAGCASAQPGLKTAFKDCFLVGAALNETQFSGRNGDQVKLIQQQFNSITPENVMKWGLIHPQPGQYEFGPADRYVTFGEANGMFIVGHCLVWHYQTPRWVFRDDGDRSISRDALLARMSNHIHTVVGRYKGRVKGWDVVNEALNEDGTMRDSSWRRIIGDDYVQKAFEFAHEADPAAELYYNDYSLENEPKRKGAVALIRKLQAAGVKIAAVGIQEHIKMDWPSLAQVDETLAAFAKLGVKVMVTELDIDVLPDRARNRTADASLRLRADPALNPYTNGLPADVQQALARRYAGLFSVYLKHRGTLQRVTFWGVTDRDSWLNNWPIRGRTAHPLLFDRSNQPKPAFHSVIRAGSPVP